MDRPPPALWRGRHVPVADASGDVVLVTSTTRYVALHAASRARPFLVALQEDRAGLPRGPASVTVRTLPDVAVGTAAAVAEGRLAVGRQWTVDLAAAAVWTPSTRPPIPARRAAALAPALLAAPSPALAGAHARLGTRLGDILRALLAEDRRALHAAVARTVGYGPGLTPSGDDTLAGLVLTTARLAAGREHAALLADAVAAHAASTTDVARQVLELACAGDGDEAVEAVLEACASGSPAQLRLTAARLVRIGATSGADTLYGIATGLLLGGAKTRSTAVA